MRQLAGDGRLIRLAIVGFVGLVLFTAIVGNNPGIFSGRTARFVQPPAVIVPTLAAVIPDLDDTIMFPGETVMRELPVGGIQIWTFSAGSDTLIDLAVRPDGDSGDRFDLLVELFGPDGLPLLSLNDNGIGAPELARGYTLPAAGEYTVWISDPTYTAGGPYALTVLPQRLKSTYPLRIGLGQTLRDTLRVGEYKFWVFSAAAEQNLSLTLLPLGDEEQTFAPRFELFAPDGTLVMRSAAVHVDPLVMRDLVLPQAGDYTLWVSDDGYDNAGEFALSIQALGLKESLR